MKNINFTTSDHFRVLAHGLSSVIQSKNDDVVLIFPEKVLPKASQQSEHLPHSLIKQVKGFIHANSFLMTEECVFRYSTLYLLLVWRSLHASMALLVTVRTLIT